MKMSEDDLLKAVIDLCKVLGLKAAHFKPALTPTGRWITPVQGDAAGFPDLVIAGPGGVKFPELKVNGNTLDKEQKVWAAALKEADADVCVWTDRDWKSGRIKDELLLLRRKPRKAAA